MDEEVKFTGRYFKQDSDFTVRVHMQPYVDEMQPARISRDRSREPESKLTSLEHGIFRGVMGQLQWFVRLVGYDWSYRVSRLTSATSSPTVADLKRASDIMRDIKAAAAE